MLWNNKLFIVIQKSVSSEIDEINIQECVYLVKKLVPVFSTNSNVQDNERGEKQVATEWGRMERMKKIFMKEIRSSNGNIF